MPTLAEVSAVREELLPSEETVEETTEEIIEETAASTEDEEKEERVEYFNDLPEVMGWSDEDFYNLKLKTSNGEVKTWSEIKDSLQELTTQQQAITAKETELAAKEQSLAQNVQQIGPTTQAVQQAQQNVATIEQAYNATFSTLEALQQDDDTAGLVRAQSELLRLQNLHAQAQQQLAGASQEQQTLQQQNYINYKQQQAKQLASKLTVFADPITRKTAVTELRDYLLGEGIQPQEVSSLVDARSIGMFYKAMQWDKHQQDVKKTAQSLRDGTVKRIVRGKHVDSKPSLERTAKTIKRAQTSHLEKDKRAAFRAVAEDAGLLNLGNS